MALPKQVVLAAKIVLSCLAVLILLSVLGTASGNFARYRRIADERQKTAAGPAKAAVASSPLDAAYRIEGDVVQLKDGEAEWKQASDSASTVKVRVFSVAAHGDLNGDGVDDAAVLLTKDAGGSGTFFYVAAAIDVHGAYQGTNAVLLGDRIAPDTTSIENGLLIHNYADRLPGEPFTTQPSMGISKYLRYQNGELIESARR